MMYKRLIDKLRTESLYKDKATLEIMDLCMEAADAIQYLLEGADEVNGALQEKIAENERMNAELERLKNCRHECNIVCLLDKYNEKCLELERLKSELRDGDYIERSEIFEVWNRIPAPASVSSLFCSYGEPKEDEL